jgi:hypothetical protein
MERQHDRLTVVEQDAKVAAIGGVAGERHDTRIADALAGEIGADNVRNRGIHGGPTVSIYREIDLFTLFRIGGNTRSRR